jgi:hypothetical protein
MRGRGGAVGRWGGVAGEGTTSKCVPASAAETILGSQVDGGHLSKLTALTRRLPLCHVTYSFFGGRLIRAMAISRERKQRD